MSRNATFLVPATHGAYLHLVTSLSVGSSETKEQSSDGEPKHSEPFSH